MRHDGRKDVLQTVAGRTVIEKEVTNLLVSPFNRTSSTHELRNVSVMECEHFRHLKVPSKSAVNSWMTDVVTSSALVDYPRVTLLVSTSWASAGTRTRQLRIRKERHFPR